MSALGSGEGLKPILMRSSTPAPNEKVMTYLESMSREEADSSPPASIVDHEEYQSNRSGSQRPVNGGIYSPHKSQSSQLRDLAASPVSYRNMGQVEDGEEDGDADSLEQQRSEGGDTVLPVPEPGPHDPPGPHYESYDSGPSFGNFGPLPTDDYPTQTQNPYGFNNWGNQWNGDTVKAETPWKMNTAPSQSGLTPGYAKVPLPESVASPRATSVGIAVESPSSKSRTQSRASRKPSEANHSPPMSPKSTSRTASKTPKLESERPLSPPMSQKSRATAKSRGETEKGTAYPPLPESRFGGEGTTYESPASPTRSRAARSKAPSVSPSDSLSQIRSKPSRKEASNVMRNEANGAEFSPRSGTRQVPPNARGPMSAGGYSHQSRPFSPYRHAPTTEDLLNAAIRGRALVIPEEAEPEKAPSVAPSKVSKAPSAASSASPSQKPRSEARSQAKSTVKAPSVAASQHTAGTRHTAGSRKKDGTATPTPSRVRSPDPNELNEEEARIVERALASATRTPRTSYYSPSVIDAELAESNFHDMDLCILLHQLKAPQTHELVRKVILKAVKQRMKKLRMAYDNESIKQYQKTHHDHVPPIMEEQQHSDEPPRWAADLKREILLMQQRIESLGPKIENLRPIQTQPFDEPSKFYDGDEEYTQTPVTQTVNIRTQATGTMAESMYQPGTDILVDEEQIPEEEEFEGEDETATERRFPAPPSNNAYMLVDGRDDSPGQQFLEEELYKLRQRPSADGAGETTWDVRRSDVEDEEYDRETAPAVARTIPESEGGDYEDHEHQTESAAPAAPHADGSSRSVVSQQQQLWSTPEYNDPQQSFPPWQKIHQRLLSWAMIWPLKELDEALNSTTRGHQVNEVAMSIWSTQTYKRYVRSRMTDTPQGVVDRLFVPPNMADAISNAVFNGRHGDACGMLRDLWGPFGLQGMPRLLVVLAKHRSDENHWVVHRFSLPDGSLTTYDSYPERTLPDGRPLGWWFAIRIAWPNAIYPSPDHLMQKMVRLHRPMQLPIDNSVAAGGIWRNILMGSRAERSLDLERLRDLINTEVKNLRQRKQLGKLSINAPRPTWEDMS